METSQRFWTYPDGNFISFCDFILDTCVSGIESLAIARAAGADMKDAEITCSAGTCNIKVIPKLDKQLCIIRGALNLMLNLIT